MSSQMSSSFSGGSPSLGTPSSGYTIKEGIALAPPVPRPSGRSPLKPMHQASTSSATRTKSLYGNNLNISLPPPPVSIFATDSPTKPPSISTCHPIAPPITSKPFFTTFSSHGLGDKENLHPMYHNDNFAEFPDPSYGPKAPLKRTLNDTAPRQDKGSKKGRFEESELPDPGKMPLVADDGRKPPYSYATLIGMSILRAPGRRLTLSHIYKWISDTFSYYRLADTGWQNSIRHNLSLNKAFIKQERPKDDPGKGNYWAIEPGMESQFVKDKASRRPTSSSGPNTKGSSMMSSEASNWPSQLPPAPASKASTKPITRTSEAFEPSSDATIPASDAPSNEDDVEGFTDMPPPASRPQLSSPPQAINSSPPISRCTSLREETPSPADDFRLPSSNLRSRKRKMAAMDDSGYFSSLDSSASRPLGNPKLPELNVDRSKIKRGRAEEEIARIRSSSHDISPSKGRSFTKQPSSSLVSSSPLRHFDNSLMLPPLTPAVKLKLPPKPPASISPNTNLRNHRNKIRELVGSPVKHTSLYSDEVSFSPAFKIVEDERTLLDEDYPAFSIFTDSFEDDARRPASTSPVKRSARRPRIDRANQTSSILADVTGTSLNSKFALSRFKTPNLNSPLQQKFNKSPLAFGSINDADMKEDLFGLDYLDDEEPDDFGGVDILQGFQKIGGNQNIPPSAKESSRPPLGSRSQTSAF